MQKFTERGSVMNDLLKAALEFSDRGWNVFPLVPASKSFYKGLEWGKEATANKTMIRQWWNEKEERNIGIATGRRSNLVVLDIDPRHGGDESLRKLRKEHGTHPPTLTSNTGSGGRHFYYEHPGAGVKIKSAANVFGDGFPGVDVRGDGGMVIAPPSVHENGVLYEFEHSRAPLRPCPQWLVDQVGSDIETIQRHSVVSDVSTISTVSMSIEEGIQRTLPEVEGQRHSCIFALARVLKGMPDYAHQSAIALMPVVKRWHTQALPAIGTKPFEETFMDFKEGWSKVKFAAGCHPIDQAVECAKASDDPPECDLMPSEQGRLIVKVARELQRTAGDAPFYLSGAKAASVIDHTDSRVGWSILKFAEDVGILHMVSKGATYTKGKRAKATRWRYLMPIEPVVSKEGPQNE